MRTVIIGQIVAAYLEDADCHDMADALAEHLPHVSDAYLRNPLALSRHLMAQGFGEPLPASGFGRDAETIMRAIVAGPCRAFAEFSKRQLAFDLRRDFERDDVPTAPVPAPTMATPAQLPQADASSAPILPPVGADDHLYAKPMAMPGLISYRIRGRYGFIGIGGLSNAEAMAQAARSTTGPLDRAKLEVWCNEAAAFVLAEPDQSEGAELSAVAFWRLYAAIAAGLYARDTLRPPPSTPLAQRGDHRALGASLASFARNTFTGSRPMATDGPVMKAALKAVGFKHRGVGAITTFIKGLV